MHGSYLMQWRRGKGSGRFFPYHSKESSTCSCHAEYAEYVDCDSVEQLYHHQLRTLLISFDSAKLNTQPNQCVDKHFSHLHPRPGLGYYHILDTKENGARHSAHEIPIVRGWFSSTANPGPSLSVCSFVTTARCTIINGFLDRMTRSSRNHALAMRSRAEPCGAAATTLSCFKGLGRDLSSVMPRLMRLKEPPKQSDPYLSGNWVSKYHHQPFSLREIGKPASCQTSTQIQLSTGPDLLKSEG